MEAEAETPSSAAAQAQSKPVGGDAKLWSNSGRTFGDMCLPKDWEGESTSDVLSATSDSYADGFCHALADPSPGRRVTLEELYDGGF